MSRIDLNIFLTRRESEPLHFLPRLHANTEQQHVRATRPYLRWMFDKHKYFCFETYHVGWGLVEQHKAVTLQETKVSLQLPIEMNFQGTTKAVGIKYFQGI